MEEVQGVGENWTSPSEAPQVRKHLPCTGDHGFIKLAAGGEFVLEASWPCTKPKPKLLPPN